MLSEISLSYKEAADDNEPSAAISSGMRQEVLTVWSEMMLQDFSHDARGATAIEYGLIAALMFLVCLTAFYAFGDSAYQMFSYISEHVTSATSQADAS